MRDVEANGGSPGAHPTISLDSTANPLPRTADGAAPGQWRMSRRRLSTPRISYLRRSIERSRICDRAQRVREGLRGLLADNNAEPVTSPRPDGLNPAARTELAALTAALPLTLDVTSNPPA